MEQNIEYLIKSNIFCIAPGNHCILYIVQATRWTLIDHDIYIDNRKTEHNVDHSVIPTMFIYITVKQLTLNINVTSELVRVQINNN